MYFIGKFMCQIWRIFFDNQLSMILTRLEAIHEKLIRLKMVNPMKMKINRYFIIGIIANVIAYVITPILWVIIQTRFNEQIMGIMLFLNVCQCVGFNEYILLISYIKWLVYMINEQIPERRSCLSTLRDMYLEVIECLHQVNRSIYGLPVIVVFIAGNVSDIIANIYTSVLFPRDYIVNPYLVFAFKDLLMKTANILILYMIGHTTEKEINRMSDVLHRRSVIERNPRIKRQIKFFLLRRLHEHFHFELYGMCRINLRQLHNLSNTAIGYLVIQILFKLNN
ncbi:uncharacterized protein LOC111033335 [Myzus persicae]|uniref:uncharacterized protein LOC111033335 n=1 Tax=Myzus persicae TaxID=13164 RepID=UPI000B938086|nr:uncharacterized protein LOC111033335 [Myzus persicae]